MKEHRCYNNQINICLEALNSVHNSLLFHHGVECLNEASSIPTRSISICILIAEHWVNLPFQMFIMGCWISRLWNQQSACTAGLNSIDWVLIWLRNKPIWWPYCSAAVNMAVWEFFELNEMKGKWNWNIGSNEFIWLSWLTRVNEYTFPVTCWHCIAWGAHMP